MTQHGTSRSVGRSFIKQVVKRRKCLVALILTNMEKNIFLHRALARRSSSSSFVSMDLFVLGIEDLMVAVRCVDHGIDGVEVWNLTQRSQPLPPPPFHDNNNNKTTTLLFGGDGFNIPIFPSGPRSVEARTRILKSCCTLPMNSKAWLFCR